MADGDAGTEFEIDVDEVDKRIAGLGQPARDDADDDDAGSDGEDDNGPSSRRRAADDDDSDDAKAGAADDDGEDDGEGGDDDKDDEPDEVEFDFGGKKLRVAADAIPKEVAEEIDRFTKGTWSDYTRKSQDLVEQSKALEAKVQRFDKLSGMNDEMLDTYSRGLAIRAELEQLQSVDTNALWQEDPDRARQISDLISAKEHELQQTITKVNQMETAINAGKAEQIQAAAKEGKALIERRIKGFEKKLPDVLDYVARDTGMPKAEAEKQYALNPFPTIWAYKAMMFDRFTEQANKPRKRAAPKEAITPKRTAGGRRTSAEPQDSDSPEVWRQKRERQLRARAGQ